MSPFTVTKSVTIRELSIVIGSRGPDLASGKFAEMEGYDFFFDLYPLIADGVAIDLILPRSRLENG